MTNSRFVANSRICDRTVASLTPTTILRLNNWKRDHQ